MYLFSRLYWWKTKDYNEKCFWMKKNDYYSDEHKKLCGVIGEK